MPGVSGKRAADELPSLVKKARSTPSTSPSPPPPQFAAPLPVRSSSLVAAPSSPSSSSAPLSDPAGARGSSPVPSSLWCSERLSPELAQSLSSTVPLPSSPTALRALHASHAQLLDKAYSLAQQLSAAQAYIANANDWMQAMRTQLSADEERSTGERTVPLSVHLAYVDRVLEQRQVDSTLREEQSAQYHALFERRLREQDGAIQRLLEQRTAEREDHARAIQALTAQLAAAQRQ